MLENNKKSFEKSRNSNIPQVNRLRLYFNLCKSLENNLELQASIIFSILEILIPVF